jgi:NADPH2:quinone reductase
MRAVVASRPGPPHVLELVELPDPLPRDDEVVVAVRVAAITFVDTQTRAGAGPRPLRPAETPVVLGNGVAGTVVATGSDVDRSWLGTRVVTATGGRGGYASRAVASAADLHRIPDGVDEPTAAAILADGRTALALFRAARVRAGDVVAITAAAGGVGGLLVQLARAAGAFVVALTSNGRKGEHASSLGATEVVDYRARDWAARLERIAPGLDVVFDGVGGATTPVLSARVARGARYLQHGMATGTWGEIDDRTIAEREATVLTLADIGADPGELHALVDEALSLAAAGQLCPTIGQTFPLARAADAHAAIEARETIGKTLLVV